VIRLVTKESATHALPSEEFRDQISIDANHFDMVKYDTAYEGKYIVVFTRLKECMNGTVNRDMEPLNKPSY
jgi:hypothetical protein